MADFVAEYPDSIVAELRELENRLPECMDKSLKSGAEVVRDYIAAGSAKAFEDTEELLQHLKITKTYTVRNGDNCIKVAFYGYMNRKKDGKKVPVPLVINQREYGNNRGEKKIPFVRPAFNKKQSIDSAMKTAFDNQMTAILKER